MLCFHVKDIQQRSQTLVQFVNFCYDKTNFVMIACCPQRHLWTQVRLARQEETRTPVPLCALCEGAGLCTEALADWHQGDGALVCSHIIFSSQHLFMRGHVLHGEWVGRDYQEDNPGYRYGDKSHLDCGMRILIQSLERESSWMGLRG